MKKTKIAAIALASVMSVSAMAGCTKTPAATTTAGTGSGGETTAAPAQVKEFSAFFAVPATTEINKDNDIQKIMLEKGLMTQEKLDEALDPAKMLVSHNFIK